MIKTQVHDGHGKPYKMKIGPEGEVFVVAHPHPPFSDDLAGVPYREYLKNTAGSQDMNVAGSLALPQVFSIKAEPDRDIYIKSISFLIADAQADLSDFGGIAALPNGINMQWETDDRGITTIADELKTNFDFIRLCQGDPAFGSGAGAFIAQKIVGITSGYFPVLDFEKVFGIPWGLKLRKDTSDCICLYIRDDITAVTSFDAIGYGSAF